MENIRAQTKFMCEIEVKEIVEDAEEQAKKNVKSAEEQAAEIKKQNLKKVAERLHEKEMSDLEVARLEQKRQISNVRFQLLDDVVAEATTILDKMSKDSDPRYKTGLIKLIIEAATKVQASDLEILINSKDKSFVKGKLAELKRNISQLKGIPVTLKINEEELSTQGGTVVRDKEKKQIFNNTYEARLAEAKSKLTSQISVILFEGLED
jgi:V/A-type H+-transporting ATPase subunit E